METNNLSAEEQYRLLIQFRKDHPLDSDVYGEVHHIQPRSCGGTDDQENLVRLLPEEHYKAHALLPEVMLGRGDIDSYKKMLHAWNQMQGRLPTGIIDYDAAEYARLKTEFRLQRVAQNKVGLTLEARRKISEFRKHFTGWHHSAETRKRISESNKGKHSGKPAWNKGRKSGPISEKLREAVRAANLRRWANPEARKRQSELIKHYHENKQKHKEQNA